MLATIHEYIYLIKSIALFFSIWWGFVNLIKAVRGHDIPLWNFVIMSAAFTVFILSMGWVS